MEFVGNQNSEGDKPTQTKAKRSDLHECPQTEPAQLVELLHASPHSSLGVQSLVVAGGAAEAFGSFPDGA